MTDEIRDSLAELRRASTIPTPAGSVAILRRTATDAGLEGDACDAWVAQHGGAVRWTKALHSNSLGGRNVGKTVPPEQYYVVPFDALKR